MPTGDYTPYPTQTITVQITPYGWQCLPPPGWVPPALNEQEMAWLERIAATSLYSGPSMDHISLSRAVDRLKYLEKNAGPDMCRKPAKT